MENLDVEAKWLWFRRQQFQLHFLEWKYMNFYKNFTEVYSEGSNWQYICIGLDNGLALNRRQVIIWINGDLDYRRIYASFGLNDLTDTGNSF